MTTENYAQQQQRLLKEVEAERDKLRDEVEGLKNVVDAAKSCWDTDHARANAAELQLSALRLECKKIVAWELIGRDEVVSKRILDKIDVIHLTNDLRQCACDGEKRCQVHAAFQESLDPNDTRKPIFILCSGCGSQQKDCKCT